MKVSQIQDSRNQHIVAIENNGELRCYSKFHSAAVISATKSTLLRDIARHGETVVDFASLPLIETRIAKSGRRIYDVVEATL